MEVPVELKQRTPAKQLAGHQRLSRARKPRAAGCGARVFATEIAFVQLHGLGDVAADLERVIMTYLLPLAGPVALSFSRSDNETASHELKRAAVPCAHVMGPRSLGPLTAGQHDALAETSAIFEIGVVQSSGVYGSVWGGGIDKMGVKSNAQETTKARTRALTRRECQAYSQERAPTQSYRATSPPAC